MQFYISPYNGFYNVCYYGGRISDVRCQRSDVRGWNDNGCFDGWNNIDVWDSEYYKDYYIMYSG